jgi:hypothetical protein
MSHNNSDLKESLLASSAIYPKTYDASDSSAINNTSGDSPLLAPYKYDAREFRDASKFMSSGEQFLAARFANLDEYESDMQSEQEYSSASIDYAEPLGQTRVRLPQQHGEGQSDNKNSSNTEPAVKHVLRHEYALRHQVKLLEEDCSFLFDDIQCDNTSMRSQSLASEPSLWFQWCCIIPFLGCCRGSTQHKQALWAWGIFFMLCAYATVNYLKICNWHFCDNHIGAWLGLARFAGKGITACLMLSLMFVNKAFSSLIDSVPASKRNWMNWRTAHFQLFLLAVVFSVLHTVGHLGRLDISDAWARHNERYSFASGCALWVLFLFPLVLYLLIKWCDGHGCSRTCFGRRKAVAYGTWLKSIFRRSHNYLFLITVIVYCMHGYVLWIVIFAFAWWLTYEWTSLVIDRLDFHWVQYGLTRAEREMPRNNYLQIDVRSASPIPVDYGMYCHVQSGHMTASYTMIPHLQSGNEVAFDPYTDLSSTEYNTIDMKQDERPQSAASAQSVGSRSSHQSEQSANNKIDRNHRFRLKIQASTMMWELVKKFDLRPNVPHRVSRDRRDTTFDSATGISTGTRPEWMRGVRLLGPFRSTDLSIKGCEKLIVVTSGIGITVSESLIPFIENGMFKTVKILVIAGRAVPKSRPRSLPPVATVDRSSLQELLLDDRNRMISMYGEFQDTDMLVDCVHRGWHVLACGGILKDRLAAARLSLSDDRAFRERVHVEEFGL